MAYRGDATDPLENIIGQRRAMTRIALVIVLLWVVPQLWRIDMSWMGDVRTAPRATMAAPRAKMSARALEQVLRSAPASHGAPRDVDCMPLLTGWDYVCVYQAGSQQSQARFKIGVRVSANEILQASRHTSSTGRWRIPSV
jgi:hypothetical protein